MAFLGRLRSSRIFQRIMRVLQFLSSVISLGFFFARLVKIARLSQQAYHNRSNRAVESILAIAVAYTLVVMLLQFCFKHGAPKILRWLLIALDLLFMGAFIAVTRLTRPDGPSGPCTNTRYQPPIPKNQNCSLPWATFILAILSTVLHFLTAVFHEVKDHHHDKKHAREIECAKHT